MVLTNVLKDYLVHAQDLVSLEGAGLLTIIKAFVTYCFQSLVFGLFYIISFQWLRDFVSLPCVFKHYYVVILEGNNVLQQSLPMEIDPHIPIFGESRLNNKGLITGLLNSFFLALPVTVPHFIGLRALLVNGPPRGIAHACGTIAGQSLFFGLILFGFEGLLTPFFRFEPLTIIAGFAVLWPFIFQLFSEPDTSRVFLRQRDKLISAFKLTFCLAWFENACVYSYFGTLSVHGDLLQTSESTRFFFLSTLAYWLGLVIGTIVFTIFFGWIFYKLYPLIAYRLFAKVPFLEVNLGCHYVLSVIICTMSLHSIPYYGLDYLMSGPLGFIYEDSALQAAQTKPGFEDPGPEIGMDEGFLVDNAPFSDEYTVAEEGSFPELTGFDAEQAWQSRIFLRNRIKDRDRIIKGKKIKPFRFDYPKPLFTSPELDKSDVEDKEYYTLTEDLADSVFRDDAYYDYKDTDSDSYIMAYETHRDFRHRYFSNPLYKRLLKVDTLSFLAGQPQTYNLSLNAEFELSQRRYILQHYLDFICNFKAWLRDDHCSFALGVYTQQFKGTMHLLRQYNAVDINFPDLDRDEGIFSTGTEEADPPEKKALTYDMPQFNRYHDEYQDFLHEELYPDIPKRLWKGYRDKGPKPKQKRLKNDLHNQISLKRLQKSYRPIKPELAAKLRYMTLNDTGPLYLGWDAELCKVMVKTSKLPVGLTPGHILDQTNSEAQQSSKIPKQFNFQAWPKWPSEPSRQWLEQLNLPQLNISPHQLLGLRAAIGQYDFNEAEERQDIGFSFDVDKDERMRIMMREQDQKDFFKRISNYDWFWRRMYLLEVDFDKLDFLSLGHTVPPRLDGIAWPSTLDRRVKYN